MKFVNIALLTAIVAATPFGAALAQDNYPSQVVKTIVPYGPGGSDAQMRLLVPDLEKSLGGTVVVENRPGAGAALGTSEVAKATPDGHTLLYTGTAALSILPHIRKLSYSAEDFIAIGNVTATPLTLVARADAPFKTIKELVEYAKANPGAINYGSSGIGTTIHLVGEALQHAAGIEFTHIPHTGMAEVATSMLNGTVDITIGIPGPYMPQVKDGKLIAIATTGDERSEFLPEVPTLTESGIDLVEVTKFGLFAPEGTPDAVVKELGDALSSAVTSPAFVEKQRAAFNSVLYLPSEKLSAAVAEEDERWEKFFSETDVLQKIGQ